MKRISRPEDLEEIRAITRGLIGEPCWQAILTYPSQLQVHWGQRIEFESERLRDERKGTWVFGAESSSWTLQCRDKSIVSSDDEDAVIKEKVKILEGARTEEFAVAYPEMTVTIRFSNGCTLLLVPDPPSETDEPDDVTIADWELFYPDGMWLSVGPGPTWRHQRADEPFPGEGAPDPQAGDVS